MAKIVDIYFKRMILQEEDFPYSSEQDYLQMVSDDLIIIKLDTGNGILFSLTNERIEYGISMVDFNLTDTISLNSRYSKKSSESFKHFIGEEIKQVLFLKKNEGNEFVSSFGDTRMGLDEDTIGVKYVLGNGNVLFVYSSEPELISTDTFKMFRESSQLCILLESKLEATYEPLDETEFPSIYKLK